MLHFFEFFCDALQNDFYSRFHRRIIAEAVAHPDEGEVDVAVGEAVGEELSVVAIGFADEALRTVAVNGVTEVAFGDGDEQSYGLP